MIAGLVLVFVCCIYQGYNGLKCAQCHIKQLYCSEKQRLEIQRLHDSGKVFKASYSAGTQEQAVKVLAREKLDKDALESLEGRWSVAWSQSWYRKGTKDHARRVLYQWCIIPYFCVHQCQQTQ